LLHVDAVLAADLVEQKAAAHEALGAWARGLIEFRALLVGRGWHVSTTSALFPVVAHGFQILLDHRSRGLEGVRSKQVFDERFAQVLLGLLLQAVLEVAAQALA